jgi:hypothetical protein
VGWRWGQRTATSCLRLPAVEPLAAGAAGIGRSTAAAVLPVAVGSRWPVPLRKVVDRCKWAEGNRWQVVAEPRAEPWSQAARLA